MKITLTPQSRIPHDPNLVLRAQRIAAPAAAEIVAPAVVQTCESDIFFLAKMDGTGSLVGYVPDVGAPMTAPEVDFDDGNWNNVGSNPGLAACHLQGDGTFLFDTTVVSGHVLVLKPGTQPDPAKPDYFLEAEVSLDPATVNMNVLLAARCGALNNVGWPNCLSFVGATFSGLLPGFEADSIYADGAGGSGTGSPFDIETLAGSVQTVKFRADVVGSQMVARVNRKLLGIWDFADPLYVAAGEIYFALDFLDDAIGGTLFQAPVMTLKAGYL